MKPELTEFQDLVNKCNSKKEFTFIINENATGSLKIFNDLYLGKNPSLKFDLNLDLKRVIKSNRYKFVSLINVEGNINIFAHN